MNITVTIASLSALAAGATLAGNLAVEEPVAAPLPSQRFCSIEMCRADDAASVSGLRALKSKLEEMQYAYTRQLARLERAMMTSAGGRVRF
jgi:hypothetical protein